jgi:uncharacterized membrane protein YgcG
MTTSQLDYPLGRLANKERDGATFSLPLSVATAISGIAQRASVVVPGQANLAWQTDLPTIDTAVSFLTLLTTPTNGHKLLLPTKIKNLLVRMIYRTAVNQQGQIIVGYPVITPEPYTPPYYGGGGGGGGGGGTTTGGGSGGGPINNPEATI